MMSWTASPAFSNREPRNMLQRLQATTPVGQSTPMAWLTVLPSSSVSASATSESVSRCFCQEENGGAGVYSMDLRKLYRLKTPEWRHDVIPEIINGHNIADFVDADIEEKLKALELEEDELAEEWLRQARFIQALR